jgi:hypothetical protein
MAFRVPSYFALRVCLRADAPDWWAAAHRARSTAPPAVRAILGGRMRVEVTEEEARAAIAWATAIDGWDPEGLPPLWVFPGLPATGWSSTA